MVMTSTDALVEFATTASRHAATPAVVRTFVDTVGVALPGYETDVLEALRRWAAASPVGGDATVWGHDEGTSAARAALFNGTAAHALDFDDAAPSMPMHPSAVLWPALLAWGEVHGSNGTALVQAFIVGQAAFRAIGEALPMEEHYPRGWHSTATVGRIAATAALISLSGIDRGRARHALGVAATMAGGSIANFGTMTKPLHAGLAAQDAVVAMELALAGLTAHESQLDHPKGFFALFGSSTRARDDLAARLDWWRAGWSEDLSVKQYPSCYGTHRAIDGVLDARDSMDLPVAEFTSIDVLVHPSGLDPLIGGMPTSGMEGKFSLPYTLVRALMDGHLGLGSFDDGAVTDPVMVERMSRVSVRTAPAPVDRPDLDGEPYAEVRITGTDGATVVRVVTVTMGDARKPLTDAQIDAKFMSCAEAAGWSASESTALLSRLRQLPAPDSLSTLRDALRRAA